MTGIEDPRRDLGAVVVSMAGAVAATEDPWEPFQLLDPHGAVVEPVRAFLADLQASGRPASTQRSYALALLRWFRFLWTVEVGWDQATRVEARDFSRWMQIADKPAHEHWRHRGTGVAEEAPEPGPRPVRAANPVTGKPAPGSKYAPATTAHSETVVRSFYEFHREALLGANWGLHDLRHTAAYRMSRDPGMPLTDVQWVLGHAQLSTTQIYLNPVPADVIAGVLAFHSRRAAEPAQRRDAAAPGRSYRSQSLEVLFGRGTG